MNPRRAKKKSPQKKQTEQKGGVPVLGIGASAGGIRALDAFLSHLPEDPGVSIVIMMHLDPHHKSELAALLQRSTSMKVKDAQDQFTPEINQVYIAPPNRLLGINKGALELKELDPTRRTNSIDYFFRSLARAYREQAICLILSGTGSDGTLGMKAIKEEGGLTLVQDPQDAEYDGMPQSAIATGLVDVILPAAELAEKLSAIQNTSIPIAFPKPKEKLTQDEEEIITRIIARVHSVTGHDFSHYKRSTLLRRIGRRMQVCDFQETKDYLELMQRNEQEAHALFKDLLISVTNFFRDPEAFAALKERVIPKLFEGKTSRDAVRVWVAGCATGEEAYSIGILLAEHAAGLEVVPEIKVFATDLDEDSINFARNGRYPEAIETDISKERLRKFFVHEANGYRVKKKLREMILFASHNLLQDHPFSNLDLILCRNVLIYLERGLQQRIFGVFHYGLRPNGYLFLGASEAADSVSNPFHPLDKKHRILQSNVLTRAEINLPAMPLTWPLQGGKKVPPGELATINLSEVHHRLLLKRYAPASVIVNKNYDLIHSSGGAGRYLWAEEGEPTQNILAMAPAPLRLELRTALFQALQKGTKTIRKRVEAPMNDAPSWALISVYPITLQSPADEYIQIDFQIAEKSDNRETTQPSSADNSEALKQMEEELQRTHELLQTSVEDYEASHEELKAANEELLSMNEELQSTTEELETGKEELQSMNEELATVNQELKTRLDELSRSNADLQNLMAATEIATIFLTRDLRVMRFTPKMTTLFNLITTDIGRPITHITSEINYEQFSDDAEQILDTLTPVHREIQGAEGRSYLAHLLPYRSAEDRIEGVVATFSDITELKKAEEALRLANSQLETRIQERTSELRETNKQLQEEIKQRTRAESLAREAQVFSENIVNTVHEGLLILDENLKVILANTVFYSMFEAQREETEEMMLYDLGNRQWNIPALRTLLEKTILSGPPITDYRVDHVFDKIGHRIMLLNASRIEQNNGKNERILLAINDVTDKKITEDSLARSEQRLLRAQALAHVGSFEFDIEEANNYFSDELSEIVGFDLQEKKTGPEELYSTVIHPDDQQTVKQKYREAIEKGATFKTEHRIVRPDGSIRFIASIVEPVYNADGKLTQIRGTMRDITHRKNLELEVRAIGAKVRQRIGQDLHDDIGSRLTGISLIAQGLLHDLERGKPIPKDDMSRVIELLDEASERSRALAGQLLPVDFGEAGLIGALDNLVNQIQEASSAKVSFEKRISTPNLDPDTAAQLYRITQEALNNAVKHSGADNINIQFLAEPGGVTLQIQDDGIGIRPENTNSSGLGLLIMQQRARHMNARLAIEQAQGGGTLIRCTLPSMP